MPRDELTEHLSWLTTPKNFNVICQEPTSGLLRTYVRRSKCEEYINFGAMAWTDLHDFTPLLPHVRIRFHDVVSLPLIQRELGVSENETFEYRDRQLYDWRLYEDPKVAREILANGTNYVDSFTGRRYYKVFTPQQWQDRPERLLQLGGVFGSTRLTLQKPEHIELQRTIGSVLQYRRDNLLGDTVRGIVEHLGGPGSFLSLHFRTGDAPFRGQVEANLEMFIRTMANITGAPVMLPVEAVEKENSPAWRLEGLQSQSRFQLIPPEDLTTPPWSLFCSPVPADRTKSLQNLNARVLVYIATDHEDPRALDSTILPWFDHFPCTVTLRDIPSALLEPLDGIRDLVDPSKSLRPFLIPLVDAMVAAHAREILTTPRSTYSRYIESLNRAWVPRDL
ncbi:hypothetical protein J3Q64DRAFT_1649292 [Phycomyces blakesleeanus]|uniref:Uncharacterized protein n=1 Tax=Phycomyces blakesleeanus TaxID=4837 RepID=A0ABR3AKT8_PHYBL